MQGGDNNLPTSRWIPIGPANGLWCEVCQKETCLQSVLENTFQTNFSFAADALIREVSFFALFGLFDAIITACVTCLHNHQKNLKVRFPFWEKKGPADATISCPKLQDKNFFIHNDSFCFHYEMFWNHRRPMQTYWWDSFLPQNCEVIVEAFGSVLFLPVWFCCSTDPFPPPNVIMKFSWSLLSAAELIHLCTLAADSLSLAGACLSWITQSLRWHLLLLNKNSFAYSL